MFKRKNDYTKTELYVGKGAKIFGNITVEGSAIVEGEIEGNVEVKGDLIVGKTGKLASKEIKVGSLFSSGEIFTEKLVGERVEFKRVANFSGDIECKILVVEEGARINGKISQEYVQAQGKG